LSRTVRGSEKPSGVFRVIALGDSTTEGFEVAQNDTYTAVLERYLKKYGVNAEVFNTGTSGFGTAEELLYLENEGIKYNPDAVVLGFFGIAAHGNPPWASSEGTAMDPREARHGGRGIGMEGYLGSLFNHGAVLVNIFGWGDGLAEFKVFSSQDLIEMPSSDYSSRKLLPPQGLLQEMPTRQACISI
jgi:hypothetical protein